MVNKCYRSDKAVPSHIAPFTLYAAGEQYLEQQFRIHIHTYPNLQPTPTTTIMRMLPSSAGDEKLSDIFYIITPL